MFFIKLSIYHRIVLLIYVAVMMVTGIYFGQVFNYSVVINNFALIIFFFSQLLLLAYLYLKERGLSLVKGLNSKGICLAIVYAFCFAIPEEILFRGVIQGSLLSSLDTHVLVFVSSVIFGLAHVFNASKSFKLKDWNIKLVGLVFLGGLPLGYIYSLTQSLFLPTLLHAMFLFWLQVFDRGWKDELRDNPQTINGPSY